MTNRGMFTYPLRNTTQWVVLFVVLCILAGCGRGNAGQTTRNENTSADVATTPMPPAEPALTDPDPLLFITPRPVRDEEPLSPDERNIPSVFPGINVYHDIEATLQTASLPLHSPTTADEAAKAVVQIYRCRNNNCDTAVGSGVIIHRSGIIATAYHVLLRNPANPNSGPFDDENDDTDNIVIALTMDVSAPAEPRFQARLVATRADQDLALLQIVRDLAGNPIGLGDLALPTLAIADVANLFDEEFRVLGYQTRSREPISVERVNFRRYENGGRLIAVNRPLEPGNSGGPVLLEAAGGYAVAGIVIRRRTTQGQLVPEGLVRTIGQLHTLQWTPGIPRAWGESVTTTVDQRTQAHRLQLGLSLNTIDLNDHRLRLLFYAIDAETEQPWQPANAAGPLVLWADVRPQQVTGQQTLTLTVPTARLGAPAERLHFRLLIWDWNAGETLWVDSAGV